MVELFFDGIILERSLFLLRTLGAQGRAVGGGGK
jgi:hypothetical protein